MYQPYMNNFNPYQQRLSQMEQMAQSQPIQTIQPTTPQSQCYFVSSKDEMQNIQPIPNVFYIGINRKSKEVYIRAWNNNGIIDFDTYSLTDGKKESTELKSIMDKLNAIEEKVNERNNTKSNPAERNGSKSANAKSFQPNDARED